MEIITLLLGFVVGVMVGFFLPLFAVWYSQRTITIRASGTPGRSRLVTADKLEYGLYWVRRPLVTARQNEDGTWTILPEENRRYLRLTDEEFRATFIVPERSVKEDQALAIQALGGMMSEISERCYCAGWMLGTEDAIAELVRQATETEQDAHSGFWHLSLYEARLLKMLHDYVGGWVTLAEDGSYTLVGV